MINQNNFNGYIKLFLNVKLIKGIINSYDIFSQIKNKDCVRMKYNYQNSNFDDQFNLKYAYL